MWSFPLVCSAELSSINRQKFVFFPFHKSNFLRQSEKMTRKKAYTRLNKVDLVVCVRYIESHNKNDIVNFDCILQQSLCKRKEYTCTSKCSSTKWTYSVFAVTFRTVPVWWDTHRIALRRTFRFFSLCPAQLCPVPVDSKFSTEFCWFPILFYPFYWCPMFFSRLYENRSGVSKCITIKFVVRSKSNKNGRHLLISKSFHWFLQKYRNQFHPFGCYLL